MGEDVKYKGVICRGSWALGTACKRCEKCRDTDPMRMTDQPIATGELKPFEREERYIVVKLKRLQEGAREPLRRYLRHLKVEPVECVVVESDWPEYETVWKMIEDRVTARVSPLPNAPSDATTAIWNDYEADFNALSDEQIRHETDQAIQDRDEVARLREALEHWERQAVAWMSGRQSEAIPGWMQPAIVKGSAALASTAEGA